MMASASRLGGTLLVWIVASQIMVGPSLAAGLVIAPGRDATLEGWNAGIETDVLSSRVISLAIVPARIGDLTLTLTASGLDEGDYLVAISGKGVQRTSSAELAKGIEVVLPHILGDAISPFRDRAKAWVDRIDRTLKVAADLGYPATQAPPSIKKMIDFIHHCPDGLDEAVDSKSVKLRIARAETGSLALPPLSPLTLEEIQQRETELNAVTGRLLRGASSVDEPSLVRELMDRLFPLPLDAPDGDLVDLALAGKAGQGEVRTSISNPPENASASLVVKFQAPKEWVLKSEPEQTFDLSPGEKKELSARYEIPESTPDLRVTIPIEIRIKTTSFSMTRRTGVGFGKDYVKSWKIIGPFPCADGEELDEVLPPEQTLNLSEKYAGMGGKVGWRDAAAEPNGYVDLGKEYPSKTGCAACAAVWLYVPVSQPVTAAMGSDDGLKVWLNGTAVHRNPTLRAATPDSDVFTLPLTKGWNPLLVKVTQEEGGWGFYLDIRDSNGRTPKGLKVAATPPEK